MAVCVTCRNLGFEVRDLRRQQKLLLGSLQKKPHTKGGGYLIRVAQVTHRLRKREESLAEHVARHQTKEKT